MHHHVQTLRHVELIREELAAQGKWISKFELERDLTLMKHLDNHDTPIRYTR
jgi:hypothetical protein